ncbi:MmgE/PrpD family protein [Belnapia sp. T18]|uniref:MmgE/PrpD family protein n=1 Tax=Belnapia arida TaxID=2804533 RepID=A0ABS1U771_9PROT|nr:MmgE/PrpD family protein [Belnapia arida]MBL6080526.1 MmgE/PrpD family protein [Belnapia arida]
MSAEAAGAGAAPLTRVLAEFVVGTRQGDIPPLALDRAAMSLASTIASAAAGLSIPSAAIVRAMELDAGGAPAAAVWFTPARLPARAAARTNAVCSDAAAADDSDMRSIAHIGTIVSTVSMALAEELGLGGAEMLRAMVLGYEVAGRIDEALTPGRMRRGFHGSVSTVFGGAVAAGTLLGLDEERMTHAIALAATSVGGMAIAADTSWAREWHAGLAAMLGLDAARAAARGFRAEPSVLEAPRGFLSAMNGEAVKAIAQDLGASWDIVTDMAIKLMPGAHPFHAIAEAASEAAIAGNVRPDEVERIVLTAAQLADWHGPTHPTDLVGAAHSFVYFVAAAVADRGFRWEHIEPAKMADPVIQGLLARVVLDPNPPPLPDRFPHRHGGTVTLVLKDGREVRSTCKAPRGSHAGGLEWADVEAKYRRLVPLSGLAPDAVEASLVCIRSFRTGGDVGALTRRLALPSLGEHDRH